MPGMVPPVADEREALLGYLAQQRLALRVSAHGLTDEQARLAPTAGRLSIGGLVRHLTAMERGWTAMILDRYDASREDYEANFVLPKDQTLAEALDVYAEATAATHRCLLAVPDLGQAVAVPHGVPWFPDDVEAWSVRWVLLHLIEETARHAGHADLVREAIDGATAFSLMAAVEGWPASPWMQPWEPAVG
jgi:uncharacterized damage-inducible protein DinB